jgi:hypothetical protein
VDEVNMMVSRSLSFGISVAAIIVAVLISGCVQQPGVEPVTPGTPTVSPPTTIPGTTPSPPTIPPTTPQATFDVKITSFTCTWTVKTGDYGVKSDCVRIIAQGTARGPVGARLELPILAWSDDTFNCGQWTLKKGALIAVGSTCVRKDGQPESTTWIADTGGDNCPLKDYFNNERSHTVKIYKDNDLTAQKEDSKRAVCQ